MDKIKVKLGQVWANPNTVHQIGEVVEVAPEVARLLVDGHGATAVDRIPEGIKAPAEKPEPMSTMDVIRQLKPFAELPVAKDPLQVTPSVVSNPKTTSLVNMVPDSRVDEGNYEDFKAKKEDAEKFAGEKAAKEKAAKEAQDKADNAKQAELDTLAANQRAADKRVADAQDRANKEADRKTKYEGDRKEAAIAKVKEGK